MSIYATDFDSHWKVGERKEDLDLDQSPYANHRQSTCVPHRKARLCEKGNETFPTCCNYDGPEHASLFVTACHFVYLFTTKSHLASIQRTVKPSVHLHLLGHRYDLLLLYHTRHWILNNLTKWIILITDSGRITVWLLQFKIFIFLTQQESSYSRMLHWSVLAILIWLACSLANPLPFPLPYPETTFSFLSKSGKWWAGFISSFFPLMVLFVHFNIQCWITTKTLKSCWLKIFKILKPVQVYGRVTLPVSHLM